MASNKDFIEILRSIRGSAAPGQPLTDGIWYELTMADIDGNPGIYGDILAKYGVVVENTATLNQAVAIIDGLTVVANGLAEGATPTASLIGTTLTLGIPVGATGAQGLIGPIGPTGPQGPKGDTGATGPAGADGVDGHTPTQLEIDAVVSANVNVQAAQTLLDDTIIDATIAIGAATDGKIAEYDANATDRVQEYDDNHTTKLATYNSNDVMKIEQYNANHIARLEEINYAYADRIIEMIKTRNFMGIMDEYVAQTETHMIPFLSTTDANYIYYGNGILLELGVDYTVYDSTTIELAVKANPYDVIVQVNTQVLSDMLTAEGVLFEDRIGAPNGVAGLDANGLVSTTQLPSYVDDVIEVATYAELPVTGETDKIYIVVADETSGGDTSSYRWTGTVYAMVSNTLTAADVKALYESNLDTNAYTDSEKTDVGLNTIHRTSDGSDHTFINQDVTTTANPTFNSISVTTTVDGRDLSTDGAKLDGIEANAKDDQIAIEVPYTNTTSGLVATEVQSAIDEVDSRLDTAETKLLGIESGATADQIASEVPVTPTGNIESNNVQTALEELQTDIDTINATIEW